MTQEEKKEIKKPLLTCEYQDGRRPLEISTFSDKVLNWHFRSRYHRILIEFVREEIKKEPVTSPDAGELPWWTK